MSAEPAATLPRSTTRPVVSNVQDTAAGRSFTITFSPGQHLPAHSNASRVVIAVVSGSGEITVLSDRARRISQGDFVQLEPNESHEITAGDDGLQLLVSFIENCCRVC